MDGKYMYEQVCSGETHMTKVFVKRTILSLQCVVRAEFPMCNDDTSSGDFQIRTARTERLYAPKLPAL